MTIDAVSEMTNNALYVIIKVSLPVLLVSLIVGPVSYTHLVSPENRSMYW